MTGTVIHTSEKINNRERRQREQFGVDKTETKVAYKHKNAFKSDTKNLTYLHIKKKDNL